MIEVKIIGKDPFENTDFLKEYFKIKEKYERSVLTEESRYLILKDWEIFIYQLINRGLIDSEVGLSLIEMLKETLVINA
jgi:hypothetical protein